MAGIGGSVSLRFANQTDARGIELILKHYNSPHAQRGSAIATAARTSNVNPIVLLAVMQQESRFGTGPRAENVANPWSIHFNENAKGIMKLRKSDGSLPSFDDSLRVASSVLARATSLTDAAQKLRIIRPSWVPEVAGHCHRLAHLAP